MCYNLILFSATATVCRAAIKKKHLKVYFHLRCTFICVVGAYAVVKASK